MKSLYHVLRRPIITEKTTALKEFDNQVVFEIDRRANKHDVRAAVEKLFNVRVAAVNTMNVMGKPKRFGRVFGRRPSWKKAIVTLHEGEDLDFFEGALDEEPEEETEDDEGNED